MYCQSSLDSCVKGVLWPNEIMSQLQSHHAAQCPTDGTISFFSTAENCAGIVLTGRKGIAEVMLAGLGCCAARTCKL